VAGGMGDAARWAAESRSRFIFMSGAPRRLPYARRGAAQ
jgi:hypothetical protein